MLGPAPRVAHTECSGLVQLLGLGRSSRGAQGLGIHSPAAAPEVAL